MARVRTDVTFGTLSAGINDSDTSISSAGLSTLAVIAAPDTALITLDPYKSGGEPEIVEVTAHTAAATTATIVRGREGTTQRAHASGMQWIHAPVARDFSILQFQEALYSTYLG